MKCPGVAVFFLFILLFGLFTGCTGPTTSNHEKTYDARLFGAWRNNRTLEVLEFKADGTYTITEGELADWYTEPGGKLWMYGTLYTYMLSENDTLLSITEQGFSRTYRKL